MKPIQLSGITFVLCSLMSPAALARSGFERSIPNGGRYDCTLCHVSSRGGSNWNPFGQDAKSNSMTWSRFCRHDPDNDGLPNGFEVGDGNCDGTAERTSGLTKPGVANAAVCGNGFKQGTEACDDGNTNNGDGCSSSCKKEATTGTDPGTDPVDTGGNTDGGTTDEDGDSDEDADGDTQDRADTEEDDANIEEGEGQDDEKSKALGQIKIGLNCDATSAPALPASFGLLMLLSRLARAVRKRR